MGSLLGGKGNKGSNSSQGSGSSSTVSSSSSSTNPGFMAELSQVLGKSLNGTSGFTRENALEDVQGLLKQQATDALQTVMPSIARQDRSSGIYGSTTKELLQNDASARITAQLASTLTDTIGKYAAMDTDRIRGFAAATQAGTSSSSQSNSNAVSEYEQSGSGSTSGGGSGILGLFADGGLVPDSEDRPGIGLRELMQSYAPNIPALQQPGMEGTMGTKPLALNNEPAPQASMPFGMSAVEAGIQDSGLSGEDIAALTDSSNGSTAAKKAADAMSSTASSEAASSGISNLTNMFNNTKEMQEYNQISEIATMFFADGGRVPLNEQYPDNIWARARASREEAAGLSEPAPANQGITINVNSGSNGAQQQPTNRPVQGPTTGSSGQQILDMIRQQLGFADGGQVPPRVAAAMDSGKVRNGQSDVEAGGKIRGPQTVDGKDNQIIAVGGGEGILPKDVMDQPGVPELVQKLIQTYHKPVKQ